MPKITLRGFIVHQSTRTFENALDWSLEGHCSPEYCTFKEARTICISLTRFIVHKGTCTFKESRMTCIGLSRFTGYFHFNLYLLRYNSNLPLSHLLLL